MVLYIFSTSDTLKIPYRMSAFPWDLASLTSDVSVGSQVWLALGLAACYTSEDPKWGSTPQDSGEALTRRQEGRKQLGKHKNLNVSLGMRKESFRLSTENSINNVTRKDDRC